MDEAKLRLFMGVSGAIFGVVGVGILSAACVLALSAYIGVIAAAMAVGLIFLALACAAFYAFLSPSKSAAQEVDSLESATVDALADLPVDAIQAMIRKQPLAAVGLALAAGYAGMRDPEDSVRQICKVLSGVVR